MADPVIDLAMTGASTIVAAMATSAWQAARDGVLRLFRGRSTDLPAIESRLDGDAAVVERDEDADGAREDLVGGWKRQFAKMLNEHPEAAGDLRALVDQIGQLLPQAGPGSVQANIARHGGAVFAAQNGNVIVHRVSPVSARPPAPCEHPGGTV
jgi:hypothetical protein